MRFLIYGKLWIAQMVEKLLQDQGEEVVYAESRADNEIDVEKELLSVKPDRVLSFIGRTHGMYNNKEYPTIDYLELPGKLVENVRDNLYAPFVLAMVCKKYSIHFTYLGTGCIFNGYPDHGYNEEDIPDFTGSGYSTVKGFTDRIMHFFEDSALTLRLRMPIDASTSSRNFITKIMTYDKICSVKNSMSVLPELLPLLIDMSKKKVTGVINFTNPGMISHNEILEMVKEIYDSNFTWKNFTIEEQDKILLSKRSNNFLNTDKLQQLYPDVLPIKEAVRKVIEEMAKSKN
ncbi:dTDP-4-dehydrorhamnose reductase [Indivirus ILV1]|uniref:dTDP-4-dehydrorhamnose reductase n=1 Tax=Indivirus ILV1 TaxID=1977633 RepID=A0A1V0SDM3_9VIRU|nr:dTDP-4-dehydrorhamnose reductase [Indivirus ILV1]